MREGAISNLRRAAFFAVALALCGAAALPAQAPADIEKTGIPFDLWVSEGNVAQIPWQVKVERPRLGLDQRLHVTVTATVDGGELNRRGATHQLSLIARVRMLEGPWFPTYALLEQELSQPLPSRTEIEFSMEFYAVPGTYQLAVVLYDAVTRERSVHQHLVNVESIRDDPLPGAFREMPAIEFLGETVSEQIRFSYAEKGRLLLPLRSKRPVRVELLVNLDRTESPQPLPYESPWIRRMRRSNRQPASSSAVLLSALKALTDLRVENGSLHLTALDLNRRAVAFQQNNIQQMDWLGLIEAVKNNNKPVISADALSGQQQGAAFFRGALEKCLTGDQQNEVAPTAPEHHSSSPGEPQPLRVIIVLSESLIFSPGSDRKPLTLSGECNCRVFHLRYTRSPVGAFDDLDRIIKPLKPQRFELNTPTDFRRALRKIIDEVSRL